VCVCVCVSVCLSVCIKIELEALHFWVVYLSVHACNAVHAQVEAFCGFLTITY